jgi:spore coat polysaccharide biosynthesis predicted glycosyltransferase SpsG
LDQTAGRQAEAYESLVPTGCRLLLGSQHALLGSRFAELREFSLRRRGERPALRRILVSVGLMDHANLTETVLDGLARAALDVRVDVVLGGRAPHLDAVRAAAARLGPHATVTVDAADMPKRLTEADLAIGAAGTTSWERCCLGVPGIAAVCADNQELIAEALVAAGAVDLLGRDVSITPEAVAEAVLRLHGAPECLAEMSASAAALCDGRGIRRLMEVLGA